MIFALEMCCRVKEHLKKLDGIEFYHVNISCIDNKTFEGRYISVLEQGGRKLISEGVCNPRLVYAIVRRNSGMIGVFRLESQMFPRNGKFDRTGFGSDRECREAPHTAFSFLKANGNRIDGTIIKVDELANALQVYLDSEAKRVLLPITSIGALDTVLDDLVVSFNLIFNKSSEGAVYKALGAE